MPSRHKTRKETAERLLDRNSIYVYKVSAEEDIVSVLEDKGSSFFEFC